MLKKKKFWKNDDNDDVLLSSVYSGVVFNCRAWHGSRKCKKKKKNPPARVGERKNVDEKNRGESHRPRSLEGVKIKEVQRGKSGFIIKTMRKRVTFNVLE